MTKEEFVKAKIAEMKSTPKWLAQLKASSEAKHPTAGLASASQKQKFLLQEMIANAEWLWQQEQKKQQASGVIVGGGAAIPKPKPSIMPEIDRRPKEANGTLGQERSTADENIGASVTEKKILGMPKKVAIPVLIVGGLILAYVGYKAWKKYKK